MSVLTEPRAFPDVRLPERYRHCSLEGYAPKTPTATAALKDATAWAAGQKRTLVLLGKPGVGKSHLAAAAVREWWQREMRTYAETHRSWREAAIAAEEAERARWGGGLPPDYRAPAGRPKAPEKPRWCNVPQLLLDLRAEMHLPRDEQDATLWVRETRDYTGPLVLDDLGREKASDWTSEVIYALVNARYEALLPTIATSNLTPDELVANGYWPAISRLAEDGAIHLIEAPDHRTTRVPA